MTPSVSEEADRELRDATVYYAREASPALALAFVAEFERALELLCAYPHLAAADAIGFIGNKQKRGARRQVPHPNISRPAPRVETRRWRDGSAASAAHRRQLLPQLR